MKIKGYLFLSVILGVTLSLFSPVQAQKGPPASDDTLAELDCDAGEVAMFDGSEWACSDMVLQLSQLVNDQQAIIDQQAAYLQYFSLEQLYDPSTGYFYPTVRITAANLQVVNGTPGVYVGNGTGNIIAGYNNIGSSSYSCSYWEYTDESSCVANGFIWSNDHRSGSHYIVTGGLNSYSSVSGFLGGSHNTVNARYGNVLGGSSNIASGDRSSILGGTLNSILGNVASQSWSTISGGRENTVSGFHSSILGGSQNTVTGDFSSVSGGGGNTASGGFSSVSGGFNRSATADYDWAAGSLYEDY